jgi:hypothetical protein
MLLHLNETTLFYFNLRSKPAGEKQTAKGVIKDWATKVSATALPAIKANLKNTNSANPPSITQQGPTYGSGNFGTGTPEFEIDIDEGVSHTSALDLMEDEDEEEEHQSAMSSPIKGKKRLTSKV